MARFFSFMIGLSFSSVFSLLSSWASATDLPSRIRDAERYSTVKYILLLLLPLFSVFSPTTLPISRVFLTWTPPSA